MWGVTVLRFPILMKSLNSAPKIGLLFSRLPFSAVRVWNHALLPVSRSHAGQCHPGRPRQALPCRILLPASWPHPNTCFVFIRRDPKSIHCTNCASPYASSHASYSYGNANPKPVNQRAQDALDLPETSPSKRILQGGTCKRG